jgi:HK97 family phage major capsid protein
MKYRNLIFYTAVVAIILTAYVLGGHEAFAAIPFLAVGKVDIEQLGETLERVSGELNKVSDKLSKQAEEVMKEVKQTGTLAQQTKDKTDDLIVKQTDLTGKVGKIQAQIDEIEQKGARRGPENKSVASVGNQVITSEALKGFGKVQQGKRCNVEVKMTTTSVGLVPTDGGAVVEPQRLPGIQVQPKQRLFIRDLLSTGRTTSPALSYVRQTGFTNRAKVVSEGIAKPYSDITFDVQFTPVATIAHMFKASKQIMDDFAQLQSTIDTELRYGLKYAEEREILLGDGTGIHLNGIIPQATAYHHEFVVPNMTPIDDLRLALLQSQLARLPANAFVLHFIDWARIELTKDSQGRYILANPQSLLGPTLWGLPVVATEVPELEGEFLTGPFAGGAQIFDREDANVVISTENADDFEKNLISIRCEERAALAVYRPEGFITGALTVGT